LNPTIYHFFLQELKALAIALQFYSTKAYNFVRKTFMNSLTNITTIRKWLSNIEGKPGFSGLPLNLLRVKADEQRKKGINTLVAVMLDDMALHKEIEFDFSDSCFKGFIDIGCGSDIVNPVPARDVLVIMAVGINSYIK